MKPDTIKHRGIITAIHSNSVEVNIVSESACSSCHAKGSCSASDVQEKNIQVQCKASQYSVGEKVNVNMAETQGFKAAFWAYMMPLIILIFTMLLSLRTLNETQAGVLSLTSMAAYFLILYLGRGTFFKSFTFKIEKI